MLVHTKSPDQVILIRALFYLEFKFEPIKWLLEQDTSRISQGQCIQLLAKLYKRRRKRLEISIGQPFPDVIPKPIKRPKNIVRQALHVKAFLSINPNLSYIHAAENFNLTKARISQLIKIVDNLPARFVKTLEETEDVTLLRRFSGRQLLKLTAFKTRKHVEQAIDSLMPSCE